jgi:uncharacterized protein
MLAGTHADGIDRGPRKAAAGSERFCAATGQVKPVAEMIRFVLDPSGAVVPDLKRRLPGRGAWITATREALGTAISRKAFARAFRRDVRVPMELVAITERLIEQAALDALAMSRKAGKLTVGFAKTESALACGRPVVALLHAADAAPAGRRKLAAALNRRVDAAAIAVIGSFASAQLDLALGRANVVHAALLAGPESELFLARAARLDCFRAGPEWRAVTVVPGSGEQRTGKSVEPEAGDTGMTEHGGKFEHR